MEIPKIADLTSFRQKGIDPKQIIIIKEQKGSAHESYLTRLFRISIPSLLPILNSRIFIIFAHTAIIML